MDQIVTELEARQEPKFCLNIEGKDVPWDQETITAKQIAELGGWDISEGVIEVDEHNNERQLAPDEVVKLRPGIGFGKKHLWKRG